jgi:hypothetical protein
MASKRFSQGIPIINENELIGIDNNLNSKEM